MMQDFLIVGSGASLRREDIFKASKHVDRVIVINDNYLLYPQADILYFCDAKWANYHQERKEYKEFKGIKATLSKHPTADWHFKNAGEYGLSIKYTELCNGGNSGYQAINLALLLGARKIYLLGFDCKADDPASSHWFGDHTFAKSVTGVWDRVLKMYWQQFPEVLKKNYPDRQIINLTRDTALSMIEWQDINKIA